MSLRGQSVECNGLNKKPQVTVPVCWGCLGRLWVFAYTNPHPVFWDRVYPWALYSVFQIDWLPSELPEAACFCLSPGPAPTKGWCWVLCGSWGAKLRFSCLYGVLISHRFQDIIVFCKPTFVQPGQKLTKSRNASLIPTLKYDVLLCAVWILLWLLVRSFRSTVH